MPLKLLVNPSDPPSGMTFFINSIRISDTYVTSFRNPDEKASHR